METFDGPDGVMGDDKGLSSDRAANGTAGAVGGEACSREPSNDRARGGAGAGAGALTLRARTTSAGGTTGRANIDGSTLLDVAALGVAPSPARGVKLDHEAGPAP